MAALILELTQDQTLLREAAERFITERCSLEQVRTLSESEFGLTDEYLMCTGSLGWYSLLANEQSGGGSISGEGLCDAAIIAELRGRYLQPGPFVSMNVVAAALSRAANTDQQRLQLESIVAGRSLATWAMDDIVVGLSSSVTIEALPVDDHWVINGRCGVVQYATSAQLLLVSCLTSDGNPIQFLIDAVSPGVRSHSLESLDLTQRFTEVEFVDVEVVASAIVGDQSSAASDIAYEFQLALILNMVESVGALDALFELTRRYSLDRSAFGQPIGSFQAIKHQLADLSLSLESAKAVVGAAVSAAQLEQDDATVICSMAKAWLSDVGIDIAQGCFQIFAGIGFTWEHDSHLYVRRVTMNSLLYGQSDWHRERICTMGGI